MPLQRPRTPRPTSTRGNAFTLWYMVIVPMLPLTVDTYKVVSALLKAVEPYRGFANYATSITQAHIEAGYPWTDELQHLATWIRRFVLRGIGPARQSAPFMLQELMALQLSSPSSPLTRDGPHQPLTMALLSCIFLLREIEVAGACLGTSS